MTKDEMAGWHQQFDGHEFESIPGVGDGQGLFSALFPRIWRILATEVISKRGLLPGLGGLEVSCSHPPTSTLLASDGPLGTCKNDSPKA